MAERIWNEVQVPVTSDEPKSDPERLKAEAEVEAWMKKGDRYATRE